MLVERRSTTHDPVQIIIDACAPIEYVRTDLGFAEMPDEARSPARDRRNECFACVG